MQQFLAIYLVMKNQDSGNKMEFITRYKLKEKGQVAKQTCVRVQPYQFLGCMTFGKLSVSVLCVIKVEMICTMQDGCEDYMRYTYESV